MISVVSTSESVSTPPPTALPWALIHGITEAVTSAPHPHTRSEVICCLVREVYESMAWLHGAKGPDCAELTSLQNLVVEAQAHMARMGSESGGSAGHP